MLSDVMAHFGLTKSLRHVDYFETEHHRQLLKDLKAAIHEGGIVALTGVVGSGKTVLLWRMQDQLRHEGQIEVSESLVFDVPRVTLSTLKLALYYDLATEKDGDLTGKPEKSERALLKVMQRCQKPIALFIDDGHDLHGQTLRSLKQFIEKTSHRGSRLTVVLAGHPRLKHELRRPAREEIGARTTVFELEGIQGQQRRYITWLLEHCAAVRGPDGDCHSRSPGPLGRAADHAVANPTLSDPGPRTRLPDGGKTRDAGLGPHHAGAGSAGAGAHLDALRL